MLKMSKRLLACLLCATCLLALCPLCAFAIDEIDLNKDVDLTIDYTHDAEPVEGVPFDLYYVASTNEFAEFTLAGDFQYYPVEVNGLSSSDWRDLAQTLAAYADRDQLTPLDSATTNAQGAAAFPSQQQSFKPGLYLAVGRSASVDGYTYTTEPFLISLPNREQGSEAWSYNVVAQAKYTRVKNPPSPLERTVEREVVKVWKGDVEQLRPSEAVVSLLKDGVVFDTVALNDANGWHYAWSELPEYNSDESKISWSIVEREMDDYTVLVSEEGTVFTVTNTFAPHKPDNGTVSRSVQKVWNDTGYESTRPKSVRVTLLRNGTAWDSQTLNDANAWRYSWDSLPEYDDDGNENVWSVREDAVSGYVASVQQTGFAFVVTNSVEKPMLPQTGVLWWPVPTLIVCGLAFLVAGLLLKKKNR